MPSSLYCLLPDVGLSLTVLHMWMSAFTQNYQVVERWDVCYIFFNRLFISSCLTPTSMIVLLIVSYRLSIEKYILHEQHAVFYKKGEFTTDSFVWYRCSIHLDMLSKEENPKVDWYIAKIVLCDWLQHFCWEKFLDGDNSRSQEHNIVCCQTFVFP